MRDPRRERNIAFAFLVSGIAACAVAFLAPAAWGDAARAALFIYGSSAVLFGGGHALVRHFDVRAGSRLRSGEDLLVRWRIDAPTFREFAANDRALAAQPGVMRNEVDLSEPAPGSEVEVVVGSSAIQVAGHIVAIWTGFVTRCELVSGKPSYVSLELRYPDAGESTTTMETAVRFPVARGSWEDAERVVAHFGSARPRVSRFFHGPGDGSNPADLSKCGSCGHETYALVTACPVCGDAMMSRRWIRRYGAVLAMCGLFLTAVMGAVLYYNAPLMLHPGRKVDGSTYTGSAASGIVLVMFFGLIGLFGLAALLYGGWQLWTGQRNRRAGFMVLRLAFVVVAAALIGCLLIAMDLV